jgi:hypothetical protein
MRTPVFAKGNSRTLRRLKQLRQDAQTDKAPRVALRLEAIKRFGVNPYIFYSSLTFWPDCSKPLASCRAKCECSIPVPCIT